MIFVYIFSAVILWISAILSCYRIIRGPSSLDRLIASDVLVAIITCAMCLWAMFSHEYFLSSVIVTLSLVSFIGSVAVARFRVPDDRKD